MTELIMLAQYIAKLGVFTAIKELANSITRTTVGSIFNIVGLIFGGGTFGFGFS